MLSSHLRKRTKPSLDPSSPQLSLLPCSPFQWNSQKGHPSQHPEFSPHCHQSGSVQLTGGTSLSWSDGVPQAWMEVAAPPTAFPPQDWVSALPSDPPSDPHQAHTGCLDGQWGARRP